MFEYGFLTVPEIICLIKKYCVVAFLSKIWLNKKCSELNLSGSVIQAVTHKLTNY